MVERLYQAPPKFTIADQASITTGQIQIVAYQYTASWPDRYPSGVGILSGSGLADSSGF